MFGAGPAFSRHRCFNTRTNSINFSSITEDKHAALIVNKHAKRSGSDVITAYIIRIEQVQTGSDSFCHVKHSRSATERKRDIYCESALSGATESVGVVADLVQLHPEELLLCLILFAVIYL